MKIGIISLVSDTHDPEVIDRASKPTLNELRAFFELEDIRVRDIERVDVPIVFIKSGGTEHKFRQMVPALVASGRPITLMASGSNNSLAASLEILSWLNQRGHRRSLLLHGAVDRIFAEKIEKRAANIKLLLQLKQTVVGVIGRPSEWLITSDIDYDKVASRWGVKLKDIELEEILDNIPTFSYADVKEARALFPEPQYVEGPQEDAIDRAVSIYLSLKKAVAEYGLTALTMRCFDLLSSVNNTGCLALARLNDEGITAGCEGDIPALFTMIINHLITGSPAFMSNPAQIEEDFITFAHCTVPTTMVDSFGFRTHFESGIGVGLDGEFAKQPVTVSKIGGTQLDRHYVAEGTIVDRPHSETLCRTQVTVKMERPQDVEYFLTDPLGNHHIIGPGSFSQRFKEVLALI